MFGRKSKEQLKIDADYRETFRWGIFDESGYVNPMFVSNSKKDFAKLDIPEKTKPFKYPLEGGHYVDVYLKGKEELDTKFSRDGKWLDAELLYSNSELSGSLAKKLSEQYHRIGQIKMTLGGDFSIRANLFIVLIVMFAGIGLFYTIGTRLFH